MFWIIQKNLLNDDAYWRITIALDEMEIPWKPIDIVPFSDELELPTGWSNPCVVYGSTSLQRLVKARPEIWPGVWANENFDYEKQIAMYGKAMLNHDAKFYAFKDVPEFDGVMFIRPVHDTKAFTGTIVGGDEFRTWQNRVLGAHIHMFVDTPTMVASPKNVKFEYRFFVIGGKVRTGSLYHVNDRLVKRNADGTDNPLDGYAREFAQSQVDHWQPADAFVMDIGVLEDDRGLYDFRIVEINSFNCSGVYECDVREIIQGIESLAITPPAWAQ